MTALLTVSRFDNLVPRQAKPEISVLIPYYKDNPAPLMDAMDRLDLDGINAEVLIYDDGTNDPDLTKVVLAHLKNTSHLGMSVLIAEDNHGRSFARNYLMNAAKADWVLFLDADMRPTQPDFLKAYIRHIKHNEADVIFGGFTVPDSTEDRERELHRALSLVSDCLTLEERQKAGPQFVCSSNLCVKKTVLESEPFDAGFSGWGWEDSEWAARISGKFRLIHIENPAIHLGLETTDTLLTRFKTSGGNYRRFTDKHPDMAKTLSLYKISSRLRHIPGQALLRPILGTCVRLKAAPITLRLVALKLWRASWYAEALS